MDRAMLQALEDDQDLTVVTLEEAEPVHGKESARTYFKNNWHPVREVDTVTMNAWGVGRFVIPGRLPSKSRIPSVPSASVHLHRFD
jgi:hypothetical protein